MHSSHQASARRAAWATQGERSNALMLRVMSWISLRLGRRAARVVLAGIATYFLLFAPRARAASRDYLRRVLPVAPRWSHGWRHMFSFATTIHDRVYLLNDRFDLFDIQLHGVDAIDAALAGGGGAFVVSAHFGSFEVLRTVSRLRPGLRVAMMMHEDNARKINAALQAINPRAGHDVIGLGRADAMLRLQEALDAGAIVGMLADRCLGGDETVALPFLGAEVRWPLGPWRIAALLRRPVILALGVHRGGNRYEVRFERLADFRGVARGARDAAMRDAVAAYVARLQAACVEAPYDWFNFFDFFGPAEATANPR